MPSFQRFSSIVSSAVEQEELPSVPDITHKGQSYYVRTDRNRNAFDRFYADKHWTDPNKNDKFYKINWDNDRQSPAWEYMSHACNAETGEPAVSCVFCLDAMRHACFSGTTAMKNHYDGDRHKANRKRAIDRQQHDKDGHHQKVEPQTIDEQQHIRNYLKKMGRHTTNVS